LPTDPGTRSPGRLVLLYNTFAHNHQAGAHFVTGTDLTAISAIRTEANAFAAAFKQVLSPDTNITGWRIVMPDGTTGYEELFSPAIPGTHSASGTGYVSYSVTLSGLGVPTTVGGARGKTRVVAFTWNAFPPGGGVKQYAVSGDTGLTALSNYLHSSLKVWADFYGQHAEPHSWATVQFNAHVQRTSGN